MFRLLRAVAARAAPLLGWTGLSAYALLALACGIPIAAGELTATAVNGGLPHTLPVAIATETSSYASQVASEVNPAAALTATATPSATPQTPSATPTPTPTPTPAVSSSEATASLTSTASATITATPTPSLSPTPTPTSVSTPIAPSGNDPASQVLKLVNEVRARQGLAPFRPNANLAGEADAYAELMADKNWFGHTGPDGSTPASRCAASGYRGQFRGEVIAAGQTTAQEVVNAWLNSSTHAPILLDRLGVDAGVGYYLYETDGFWRPYWVMVTGVP